MSEVKIVRFGLGEVACNWGTYEGKPAVFLEPIRGNTGEVGSVIPEGVEPQIRKYSVSDGIILQFHGEGGANILLQDIQEALSHADYEGTSGGTQ